eukprot:scaffold55355_cov26-Cyclotella_meneghiniana.AAC.1
MPKSSTVNCQGKLYFFLVLCILEKKVPTNLSEVALLLPARELTTKEQDFCWDFCTFGDDETQTFKNLLLQEKILDGIDGGILISCKFFCLDEEDKGDGDDSDDYVVDVTDN